MQNIAAIDVGSNAMRMVIGRIVYDGKVEVVENLRLPVRLGRKYQFDQEHAKLVSQLAGSLFDQLKLLHGLDDENKLLLEVAALLHDIGHFINAIDHQKHGYYILKANPLMGLVESRQDIIANIIHYHRKSMPSLDDGNFKNLNPRERNVVVKLSALLRVADAFDVSHTGSVKETKMEKQKNSWLLTLHGRGDLALERWTLEKRVKLFQEVFDVKLKVAG